MMFEYVYLSVSSNPTICSVSIINLSVIAELYLYYSYVADIVHILNIFCIFIYLANIEGIGEVWRW